jgi:hypothetical protein
MCKRWLAVAVCVAAAGLAPAMAGETGRPARLVVAELFTSEGCSSCPPADAVLSELARTRPDVLPLAFHITYWDRLGWPDPFAFEGATERQRGYAAVLGLDSIYTPQLVVDGTRDVVGSDRGAVLRALVGARAAAAAPVDLRLTRAADGIAVAIGAGQPDGRATLLLAGYDSAHRTVVAHGENAGRTLTESNIVRALVRAGDWRGAPLTLRAAAPAGEHVAAILQAPDGHILATAVLD